MAKATHGICSVCGKGVRGNSVNIEGFHVHKKCLPKIVELFASAKSAQVNTQKVREQEHKEAFLRSYMKKYEGLLKKAVEEVEEELLEDFDLELSPDGRYCGICGEEIKEKEQFYASPKCAAYVHFNCIRKYVYPDITGYRFGILEY